MSECYWFTGLSGAGKTTLAIAFQKKLKSRGVTTVILDGDQLRDGVNKGLGFSREDRAENVRRIASVAKLLADQGVTVLVSAISPYADDREVARDMFEPGKFIEIFVKTPFATCEARDTKGLYKKARAGLITHFTGIDDPYEEPLSSDVEVIMFTENRSVPECVETLYQYYLDN